MRFDVITLFPEFFAPFLVSGVTRRAYESGLVKVKLWNPRDFADGNYRRVDDRPFGGGPGMVMLAEPLALCLEKIKADRVDGTGAPVILFSPVGQTLNHTAVEGWAASSGAVLICGRYEGIDQRFITTYVDHQISLGDFVLSGGEIAAMALLDAVARFNPALDGLLDCPHYTRPEAWRCQVVPETLLSGNHAHIERWRRDQRLALTQRLRPELVLAARTAGHLSASDESFLSDLLVNSDQDA
jgi:tRNA (guanine37-N1)-methyltransferase